MSEFKVGCSPLTSEIYAGSVSKNGLWGKKHKVTDTAVAAVAQYLLQKDEHMVFNYMGKEFRLQVVEEVKELIENAK